MKTFDIVTKITQYAYDELPAEWAPVVEQARKATERSYAPYSHFRVGAAILLDNGQVVTGSNQENVAYPSGTCAERSACFYAGAQYPDAKFRLIAIAARGTDGEWVSNPIAPCGACRQALLEYEMLAKAPVPVLLCGADAVYHIPSVAATLPLAFTEF